MMIILCCMMKKWKMNVERIKLAYFRNYETFDLFFDSLDTAELKAHVQSLFPWSSNPPLLDLKLVWDYVMMGMGKTIWEEYLKSCDWEYDVPLWFLRDKIADFTEEKTILDLLKLSFKQDMSQSFCFDYVS